MFGDLFSAFGRDVTLVLLTRLAGIVCLICTLSVVTGYARVLEQSQQLEIGQWAVEPQESVPLLVIVGLTVLFFMIVGSALNYLSGRWSVRLRGEYGTYCGQRVISRAAVGGRLWMPSETDEQPDRFLRRLARRNATRCGRVASQLITTVVPTTLVLIVAIPVLFHINAWLTLVVIVLLSVSLTIHYQINVRAARQMLERERFSTLAAREYSNMLQHGALRPVPPGSSFVAERFARSPITDSIEADIQYRSVSNKSQFLSDLFVALTIMTILVVLGGSILVQGTGWGALLVYLIASRYTLGQTRSLLSAIANSNRFYHQIREYFLFIENTTDGALHGEKKPLPKNLTLRVRDPIAELHAAEPVEPQLNEQLEFWNVHRGEAFDRVTVAPCGRISVLSADPITRFTLPKLLAALLGKSVRSRQVNDVLAHAAIVTRRSPLMPASTLAAALGFDPQQGLAPIRPTLEACGQWQRVRDLLAARESSGSGDGADSDSDAIDGPVPELDDELRILLILAAVSARGFPIVLVERSAIRKLGEDYRDIALDQFSHAVVFLIAGTIDEVGRHGEDLIAILHDGRIAGLGNIEWLEQHRATIEAHVTRRAAGELVEPGADDDDDLEAD